MSFLERILNLFVPPASGKGDMEVKQTRLGIEKRLQACETHLENIRSLSSREQVDEGAAVVDMLILIDVLIEDLAELKKMLSENTKQEFPFSANLQALERELASCRMIAEGNKCRQIVLRMIDVADKLKEYLLEAYGVLKREELKTASDQRNRMMLAAAKVLLFAFLLSSPWLLLKASIWYKSRYLDSLLVTNISTDSSIVPEAYLESGVQEVRDLSEIALALEKYCRDNEIYPESSQGGELWDGLHSVWGKSKQVWIKGLVPKYMEELPTDPRNSDEPQHQYIYRSDRFGYKLGIVRPREEIRDMLKEEYPEMKDGGRRYISYGIWTERAKKW